MKAADRTPSLRGIPCIYRTTEEKAWKNLSQGSRNKVRVAGMYLEYVSRLPEDGSLQQKDVAKIVN